MTLKLRVFTFLMLFLFLNACQTTEKIIEVVKDPDIQVGEDSEVETEITINAVASSGVNGGRPIVITLYALSSDHRFYGYDIYSLIEDPKTALGPTLIDQLDEIALNPGEYDTFGPYKMPEGTKYIAAIAQFANFENTKWRTTVEVDPVGEIKSSILNVTGNAISIRLEE